ncbi:TlpA disulfide reductase family protein [uncultured Piscinibacter sp.]|uniref:TlpA family protein disulfide reductase n=1 Tax=uncultured Piscinibacter sp. TaxID=1131835 RepID=UPI0026210F5F|nr:TlpA disulfide reductase family protein [uncultured Piscinibacter sp.]
MNVTVRLPRRTVLRAGAAALLAHASLARASFEVRPWPSSRAVPPLSLVDLDGRTWSLAALRGRPVVLNFWATWCEPCRAEMPSLDLMALKHERDGLAVLTINFRESASAIRRFLDAVPLSLPVLLDRDGAAARAFAVSVFPTTLMVSRRGRPVAEVRGEVDWTGADGRALVESLIAT